MNIRMAIKGETRITLHFIVHMYKVEDSKIIIEITVMLDELPDMA